MTVINKNTHVMVVELNSLPDVEDSLIDVWSKLDNDEGIRVAVLSIVGPLRPRKTLGPSVLWESLPLSTAKPVIAAIEGPCHGRALEMALSCDLRMADEDATFGLPDRTEQFKVASVLLPRSTSTGFALEVLLAGRVYSAAQFRNARLVNRTTSSGHVLNEAIHIADELALSFESAQSFRKQEILAMSGQPLAHVMARVRTAPPTT